MTQVLLGKEVPSLKITLENDADSDPEDFEEGEISEPESNLSVLPEVTDANAKPIKVNRPFSEPQKGFKVYENRGGAFVTGLDLSPESLMKKLEGRASRFGLQKDAESKVTQEEINALYTSMGIDLDSLKNPLAKTKNYRLDTIHMRGVDEMSTNEIFAYFNEYGPASVEWINDSSCNIVWLDETSTARALLGMSQKFDPQKKSEQANDSGKDMDTDIVKPNAGETIVPNDDISFSDDSSDDSSGRVKGKSSKENPPLLAMDVDTTMAETISEEKANTPGTSSIDVPVPPGHWRVGTPHKKAKALLLRFATKDDRKLPGAEKRSNYYQKYGNPNFGGMTGLISKSRKRKMLATRTRQVVESLKGEQKHPSILLDAGIGSGDAVSSILPSKQSRSKIRMRMYADDEEEKQERKAQSKRFKGEEIPMQRKGSVHSRLGRKFTTTQLRNYQSDPVESDEETELQITREVKVPSRYDVWTSLAKSMAEEDANISSSSRQRKRPTEDLRNSLSPRISSQVRIPERRPPPRQNKDLRSRIKEIRKDSHLSTKHRSPLLMPDREDSDESSSSE